MMNLRSNGHCERLKEAKPFGPERLDLRWSAGLTAEGQSLH
jgi:hypothetical protein